MAKNKRNSIILLAVFFALFFLLISSIFNVSPYETVPLLGLPKYLTLLLANFVWPFFCTVIFVILMPRLIVPLYLKFKGVSMKKYQNFFVKREKPDLKMKTVLKRTLFVSLLCLGLTTMLFNSGILDPALFLDVSSLATDYPNYPNDAENIFYDFNVLLGGIAILVPLVAGLWAVGWTLEDAGVMHYYIAKEGKGKLFEIEPVHYRYNSMLKGFTGISVIIAFVSNLIYHLTLPELNIGNMLMSIFLLVIFMVPCFLSYIIYWKINKSYVVKSMKEIRSITEEELLVFLEK